MKKKFDIAKARPMMLPTEEFKNDQTSANTLLSLVKKCLSTIKNQGMLPMKTAFPAFLCCRVGNKRIPEESVSDRLENVF